jgi:hypothetical protein
MPRRRASAEQRSAADNLVAQFSRDNGTLATDDKVPMVS